MNDDSFFPTPLQLTPEQERNLAHVLPLDETDAEWCEEVMCNSLASDSRP